MACGKKISMFIAAAVSPGAIIGSGIFVLGGPAISLAGSNAMLAFVIVGGRVKEDSRDKAVQVI